jgi:hypothetical protein
MKKIILGFALLGAVLAGCKKEESKTDNGNNTGGTVIIPETQRATVIYFGGTWCPPCGSNGRPAKDAVKEQTGDKSVLISCQVNSQSAQDPMSNAHSNSMISLFNPRGVPTIYVGGTGEPISVVQSNSAMGSNAVNAVNTVAARKPITNIVATKSEADGLINIKVNGKFFADNANEFYIAGYLLESRLNHTQVNDAAKEKNIHDNVLRSRFGSGPITGELIKASPKKDDTYTKEMSFFVEPTFKKENLSIAIVIWQKSAVNGQFSLVNSLLVK